MNRFNEKEFYEICKKLNTDAAIYDTVIRYTNSSFFNKMRSSVQRDRRGEVVFCVVRPNGKIVAITCSEYPKGIFRIPTGGINYNEDILNAVHREVREELGLTVGIRRFAGVLRTRFEHDNESVMFYSYIFILDEISGRLLLDASDDEISEVAEVDLKGLAEIVDSLEKIEGKWSDWGKFRHATSGAVLKILGSLDTYEDSVAQ